MKNWQLWSILAIVVVGCGPGFEASKIPDPQSAVSVPRSTIANSNVNSGMSSEEASQSRSEVDDQSRAGKYQDLIGSIERRLELNRAHRAKVQQSFEGAILTSEGIEYFCDPASFPQEDQCYQELKALAMAYEQGLISANLSFGPVLRIEVWTFQADIFAAGPTGVVVRSQKGKTPEKWARLLNGYLNSEASKARTERLNGVSALAEQLQAELGVDIRWGEALSGVFGFRSWNQIPQVDFEIGLETLQQAARILKQEGFTMPLVKPGSIDAIEIGEGDSEIFETDGQQVLRLNREGTAIVYAEAIRKANNPSRAELRSRRAFILLQEQKKQIASRMGKTFPNFSIDCELQTHRGDTHITLNECVRALTRVEAVLLRLPLTTPLFDEILIGNYGVFSLGRDQATVRLRSDFSEEMIRQHLIASTQEFEQIKTELEP